MDRKRLEGIENRLHELSLLVERLQERVQRLEGKAPFGSQERPRLADGAPASSPDVHPPDEQAQEVRLGALMERHNPVVAAGFTCVGLSIALLLRQLTVAGVLPLLPGFLVGAGYCLVLVAGGEWFRSRARRLEALLLNLLGTMILYMLVLESYALHGILGLNAVHTGVLAIAFIGFLQAFRHQSQLLAAFQIPALLVSAFFLLRQSKTVLLPSCLVLGLCVGVMILSLLKGWAELLWPALGSSDLYLILVVFITRVKAPAQPGYGKAAFLALVAFFFLNAGFFMVRNLVQKKTMGPVEFVQIPLSIMICFSGVYEFLKYVGLTVSFLGIVGIVLSLSCYLLSYKMLVSDRSLRVTFGFYNVVGFIYAFFCIPLLFGTSVLLPAFWTVIAIAFCLLGTRRGIDNFNVQSLLFGYAAFVAVLMTGNVFFIKKEGLAPDSAAVGTGAFAVLFLTGVALLFVYFLHRRHHQKTLSDVLTERSLAIVVLFLAGAMTLFAVARLYGFYLLRTALSSRFFQDDPFSSFILTGSLLLILTTFAVFLTALRLDYRDLLLLAFFMFLLTAARVLLYDFFSAKVSHVIPQVFVFGIVLFVSSFLYRRRSKDASAQT